MPEVKLNDILHQIETLEVEELRKLNRAIQERLTPRDEGHKRAAFHRADATASRTPFDRNRSNGANR